MPNDFFKAGEAVTAEKMNSLLRQDMLEYGEGESSNDNFKILTKKSVNDKFKSVNSKINAVTNCENKLHSCEVEGNKMDNPVSITLDLPAADESTNNKFIAFIYYGAEKREDKTEKGLRLLRAVMVYSSKGETTWHIGDASTHSWGAFSYLDTACGWMRFSIDNGKLTLTAKTFDDFETACKYYIQGWQLL